MKKMISYRIGENVYMEAEEGSRASAHLEALARRAEATPAKKPRKPKTVHADDNGETPQDPPFSETTATDSIEETMEEQSDE